jgi:hypothetical protein
MAKKTGDPLERELKTLMRRVQLIQGARAGKLELRKITVNRKKTSWTVHARTKTYYRYIAPTGWKPT